MHALHKILADKARPRRAAVTPGEYIEVEPDAYSAIVGVNAGEARRLAADLAELGIKELPLRDRIFANADHASPAPTPAFAASQKAWRDFYKSFGITIFDGGMGVSHLVMVEQGIVVPGSMAIAVDSHGATMGAVGCYATSLGGGRLTLYAIGRYWIEVPKVTLVRITGRMGKGVLGRDVALYVNGRLGQRGAYGNAVEFAGPFVDALSMDMRFTLCNMGIELGAVAAYMQPDATTLDWVKKRTSRTYKVHETDRDYAYDSVHEIDISAIAPQIAVPHAPDDVKPVAAVAGTRIDQAYLGSCASGRVEDLEIAARIMKGRQVHPDVRFIVTPGSREVLKEATKLGYISVLHEANAIVTNANCGACPGLHGGILGEGEVAITSITRNFEGRMGTGGQIYLASPATVAASAIEGCIASPLKYF